MKKMGNIIRNVKIGKNSKIAEFCQIGSETGNRTEIGDYANIRSFTVIYPGNKIGEKLTTGHHTVIRANNLIGNEVTIGNFSIVEGRCKIGDNVKIHSMVFLGEDTFIGKGSWIGPRCVTLLTKHPRATYQELTNKGPRIGKNVVIGAGTILMPGIKINDNSMIGAGSLVLKDVPKGVVVAGNPAKKIKNVSDLKCPATGNKYEKKQN
ncbi:transferase [Candidatus Pacearchaeota archaeon]|nr:transferase [Candidatus Pacearchaeota archaeon]MBD3282683.1 transferase [Candidatus Pacearchaeota archaeon]